ncbi:MAG: ABC transporter substrate-binding protein [Oscillospiraceae bacterium]
MKKLLSLLLALTMLLSLCACAKTESSGETANASTQEPASAQEAASTDPEPSTLVYGSGDYTRINPAMDEHGEINLLIFDGLTAHDGENNVVPGLAESWDFDEETNTYTFHLRSDVTWHDGERFTANDVKFTIEAIMNPDNGSENAPNFEDVEEITVKTTIPSPSASRLPTLHFWIT